MNILIYDIGDRLPELVSQLESIKGISIFFAFTKYDAGKIIKEFKPQVIYTNDRENKCYLKEFQDSNSIINVCNLADISGEIALNQIYLQMKVN